MGETFSSLIDAEPQQCDLDEPDLEKGSANTLMMMQIDEEEFFRMQYQRMVDRFGNNDIDPRFFFGNCIFIERHVERTGETTQFCWMPRDHIIARLLICNPDYHHGLLIDTLQECKMIGCLTIDAESVVDTIIRRFRDYGLMSPEEEDVSLTPDFPIHEFGGGETEKKNE